MREQLRQEVLRRFAGAPDTQQARDLRDEILSNTLQRYDDLLAEGRSEQEAYASALESIGDVEELLSSLPRAAQAEPVREAQPKDEVSVGKDEIFAMDTVMDLTVYAKDLSLIHI